MNLSEKLQKDMAGLKAHHQRIEALADSSLQKLGFVGARAVNTVHSHEGWFDRVSLGFGMV
jgi:hypothetical protein